MHNIVLIRIGGVASRFDQRSSWEGKKFLSIKQTKIVRRSIKTFFVLNVFQFFFPVLLFLLFAKESTSSCSKLRHRLTCKRLDFFV